MSIVCTQPRDFQLSDPTLYGKSSVYPGLSAADIKLNNPTKSTTNGIYYIRVNNVTLPVYCDMTSDGGGWMLIMQSDDSGCHLLPYTVAAYGNVASLDSGMSKLSDVVINSLKTSASIFRFDSHLTSNKHYIKNANMVFNTLARSMGFGGVAQDGAVSSALSSCNWARYTPGTIDTVTSGITSNDVSRFFTDYSGTPGCYMCGSGGTRCMSSGSTTGHASVKCHIWMR